MSDLTPESLDQLEARARAATPGPWKCWNGFPLADALGREHDMHGINQIGPGDRVGGLLGGWSEDADLYATKADAEYVATADPTTILALIREVRRLRTSRLRREVQRDRVYAESYARMLGYEPEAILTDGEACDVCSHLEIEQMAEALNQRYEAEEAFSAALGWGDGKTEPAAALEDLIEPLKEALSAASDHEECTVCCDLCGEMLAGTQCPKCHGSGCSPNDALAYLECDQCAGVGKIHDGCAEKSYADLVAENESLRTTLQHVRETAEHYDGIAFADTSGAILRDLAAGAS